MRNNKRFTLFAAGIMLAGSIGIAAFGMESYAAETTGTAITEEEAKAIALKDAGVNEADIVYERVEIDTEQGTKVYEVEFNTASNEYDYEIAVDGGEIKGFSIELITPTAEGAAITEEEAKAIALEDAGLTDAADVTFTGIEKDYENGVAIYDIDFTSGGHEYDYEITTAGGQIVKFGQDIDDEKLDDMDDDDRYEDDDDDDDDDRYERDDDDDNDDDDD